MKKWIPILSGLLAGSISFLLLWFTHCPINFIPFLLHENFFMDIIEENTAILIFDIFLSLLIFWLVYKFVKRTRNTR